MRILFRYNNNLDYKKLEKKMKSMNQEYINIESFYIRFFKQNSNRRKLFKDYRFP